MALCQTVTQDTNPTRTLDSHRFDKVSPLFAPFVTDKFHPATILDLILLLSSSDFSVDQMHRQRMFLRLFHTRKTTLALLREMSPRLGSSRWVFISFATFKNCKIRNERTRICFEKWIMGGGEFSNVSILHPANPKGQNSIFRRWPVLVPSGQLLPRLPDRVRPRTLCGRKF